MSTAATHVEVSSRCFALPLECPCCGAGADTELSVPLSREAHGRAAADSARAVDFPYCRACVAHVRGWESAGLVSAGVIVAAIVISLAVTALSGPAFGLGVLGAGVVLAVVLASSRRSHAKRRMGEACSSPGKALAYLGWSGSASGFSFESMSYAAKFAEQNSTQLVEDPRVRTLLDRYKLARIAVPTPAAAVVALPAPLDVGDWVTRLASTPGRVARRAALGRALDMLHEPKQREQLIRAVAAIELAALLAPLGGNPTAADKARHVQRAIEQVRADNVPDEL
jgi:hypothetical protein